MKSLSHLTCTLVWGGLAAAAMSGCAIAPTESSQGADPSLQWTSSALTVNEDGTDPVVGDATSDAPVLERSCDKGVIGEHVRAHLREHARGEGKGMGQGGAGACHFEQPWQGMGTPGDHPAGGPEQHGDMGNHEGFGGAPSDDGEWDVDQRRIGGLAAAYDGNQDSELDDAEQAVLVDDLKARCDQRLGRSDGNGDGALDDGEWQDAKADIKATFEAEHAKVLLEYDADGDAKLSAEERASARANFEAKLAEGQGAQFARSDRDGSGGLDKAEEAELYKNIRDHVRQGR